MTPNSVNFMKRRSKQNFLRDSLLLHRPIYLLHSTCTYFILFSLITYMICFCPVTHSTALFEHSHLFLKTKTRQTARAKFQHLPLPLLPSRQPARSESGGNKRNVSKCCKHSQILSVIPLKLPWDKIECLTCCGTSFYRKSCLIRFPREKIAIATEQQAKTMHAEQFISFLHLFVLQV